ncbi:uncharacterized protein CIMG_10940 [Coccidioides immitis RS]|uniref:Secreted protein n=1 Tax=Coccidioides immitis (strain RS) TaxID=246410 RepID=A0A0D8JRN8_COCIM|nr:uncharacterized protein CIMG_10940 [Coccidioides immitis RS]KJF60020.1 hypothetical protein CIMG_10940 [Coccidioides immitis RS]
MPMLAGVGPIILLAILKVGSSIRNMEYSVRTWLVKAAPKSFSVFRLERAPGDMGETYFRCPNHRAFCYTPNRVFNAER